MFTHCKYFVFIVKDVMFNFRFLCAFSGLLLASGCGSEGISRGARNGAPSVELPSHALRAEESYSTRVGRLTGEDAHESARCDELHQPWRVEMALELDLRRAEIDAHRRQMLPSPGYRRETWGPLTVRIPLATHETEDHWETETSSLVTIHSLFLAIRSLPINDAWADLDRWFDNFLWDEEDRIVHQYSRMFIPRSRQAQLAELTNVVARCHGNERCFVVPLTPELATFVEEVPRFAGFQYWITQVASSDSELSRTYIQWWLTSLHDLTNDSVNDTITRPTPNILELPLDPGEFFEIRDQLGRLLEETWRSPTLQLRIRWTSVDAEPRVYRLIQHTAAGRCYVEHQARVVHIYNNVRTNSITHEIGHVLGLRDNYYTTWNDQDCHYIDESNSADIMSRSDTGIPTAAHWATLERLYPFTRSTQSQGQSKF